MPTVYETITERIVSRLEAGVIPWRKPWNAGGRAPMNLFSRKAYRGVNVLLTASAGYDRPEWATFNQARSIGAFVRKGEHSTPVVFWSFPSASERKPGELAPETEEKGRPWCKLYHVFNVAQIEGIPSTVLPELERPKPFEAIASAQAIADRYLGGTFGPTLKHGMGAAFYRPSDDSIGMPDPGAFETRAGYYSTLFHEMTHSTGHRSRLARDGVVNGARFASHSYSEEELIAELGACFLRSAAGIDEMPELENSAAYIAGWLGKLKGDKRLIMTAAAAAQRAADRIAPAIAAPAEVEESETLAA